VRQHGLHKIIRVGHKDVRIIPAPDVLDGAIATAAFFSL
jgi:hypothetical protein